MKLHYEKVIIGLGVWLVVLPFTGFPESMKTWLVVLTGIAVIYFGALLFKKINSSAHSHTSEKKTETFTETI